MTLGYIVRNQFFWNEDEAIAYAQGGSTVIPTVPDLIPKLARGEVVCYRFLFVGDKIKCLESVSEWEEPEQTDNEHLWLTAIAENFEMVIKAAQAAKQNFIMENFDE